MKGKFIHPQEGKIKQQKLGKSCFNVYVYCITNYLIAIFFSSSLIDDEEKSYLCIQTIAIYKNTLVFFMFAYSKLYKLLNVKM